MSLIPTEYARKSLRGKRATYDEFALYVAEALIGTSRHPPARISEIAKKLNFKDTRTVRAMRDLAIDLGYLKIGTNGEIERPTSQKSANFVEFVTHDIFCQDPLIRPWVESMLSRKQGKPLKSARDRISCMKNLCNYLRVDPEFFINQGDTQQVLAHARTIMQGFNADLIAGKAPMKKGAKAEFTLYRYVQALRSFMAHHGYAFPRGETGIMSQAISQFHGHYADVKFTEFQIELIKEKIMRKEGIDSDIFRCFCFGIQSCARKKALLNTQIDDIEKIEKNGKPVYVVKVFESKAEHKNKGIWKKYITWADLRESIDKQINRKDKYLIRDRSHAGELSLIKRLKELYTLAEVGRLDYFLSHPFHTLRHCGAHYWLNKCDYNHSLVAAIGGWHTSDELKASYGEIPPDRILGAILDD